MKTDIGRGIFQLTKYVLFFCIILLVQSCASTSDMRVEGDDFEKNLPGLWEGERSSNVPGGSGKIRIYS